jgi:hypothetical protein
MTPEIIGPISDVVREMFTAIGICVIAVFQYRSIKVAKNTEHNTNSVVQALLKIVEKEALARGELEGILKGIQQEKDRSSKP